jgi:hypothetical protein
VNLIDRHADCICQICPRKFVTKPEVKDREVVVIQPAPSFVYQRDEFFAFNEAGGSAACCGEVVSESHGIFRKGLRAATGEGVTLMPGNRIEPGTNSIGLSQLG